MLWAKLWVWLTSTAEELHIFSLCISAVWTPPLPLPPCFFIYLVIFLSCLCNSKAQLRLNQCSFCICCIVFHILFCLSCCESRTDNQAEKKKCRTMNSRRERIAETEGNKDVKWFEQHFCVIYISGAHTRLVTDIGFMIFKLKWPQVGFTIL